MALSEIINFWESKFCDKKNYVLENYSLNAVVKFKNGFSTLNPI